jgi:hypothetical protein
MTAVQKKETFGFPVGLHNASEAVTCLTCLPRCQGLPPWTPKRPAGAWAEVLSVILAQLDIVQHARL